MPACYVWQTISGWHRLLPTPLVPIRNYRPFATALTSRSGFTDGQLLVAIGTIALTSRVCISCWARYGLTSCALRDIEALATLLTREASIMVVKPHFPAFPYFHGFPFAYHLFALPAAVTSTLSCPAADSPVCLRHGVALGRNMGSTHTQLYPQSQTQYSTTVTPSVIYTSRQRMRYATAYMVA